MLGEGRLLVREAAGGAHGAARVQCEHAHSCVFLTRGFTEDTGQHKMRKCVCRSLNTGN